MKNDILIYFNLITSLKTKDDLDRLSSEIDSLLASVFETGNHSFENTLESISVKTTKKITEAIKKNNMDIADKELIKSFLETLKKLLGKFKTIRLIIAFEPKEETIENIHNWVSSNLGEGYILDIETNKGLLGGAIVMSSNGEYRDFSLKKTLEETFENKKEEITRNL